MTGPTAIAMAKTGEIRVGISGWTYKPWRGMFYPAALRQKDELAFAAGKFRTIEINGTFYGLQRPESFARWRDDTPEDFVFSVKAPRFITHIRGLRDVEAPIANFMASGLLALGPKLGPVLWQFPPRMTFNAALFEPFLALLPHDTTAAAALAQKHDARMDGRDFIEIGGARKVQHAVEIRHESFAVPEFTRLARRYGVAVVCADSLEWPRILEVTADFVYCRLHGSGQLYASGYDAKALGFWARHAQRWADSHDVFIYFDNDMKVKAPENALALARRLGISRGGEKMAKESKAQERTIEPVMHEAKEGELTTGSGKKVKSRKQAVAIALREAGASIQDTPAKNQRNLGHSKENE
jgi:uncharacterized protein YecE (DUF72 family)